MTAIFQKQRHTPPWFYLEWQLSSTEVLGLSCNTTCNLWTGVELFLKQSSKVFLIMYNPFKPQELDIYFMSSAIKSSIEPFQVCWASPVQDMETITLVKMGKATN